MQLPHGAVGRPLPGLGRVEARIRAGQMEFVLTSRSFDRLKLPRQQRAHEQVRSSSTILRHR